MNLKFEFFNIHNSHLAQLGMINITLKCQKENICKKFQSFHHYLTWFLVPITILAPKTQLTNQLILNKML
jgi:hypothetical protein